MIFHSVWLRTDSNPADINRFQSHAEKMCELCFIRILYEYLLNNMQTFVVFHNNQIIPFYNVNLTISGILVS